MVEGRKQIGIMGGTFDPVHNAHLVLAEQAYSQFSLDEVWMMPNGNPPHKREYSQADVGIGWRWYVLQSRMFPIFGCAVWSSLKTVIIIRMKRCLF